MTVAKAKAVPTTPAPTPAPSKPVLTNTATIVIGAILGVAAGFVHAFGFAAPWPAILAGLITLVAAYGVNVITGPAFKNLLHLSPQATLAITGVLTAVAIGAPSLGLSAAALGVVQGVIAFAASLGFGTAVSVAVANRTSSKSTLV